MQGNRIKTFRKAAGLTQAELAERCGTSRNMLLKIEGGSKRLNTDWLERIAHALDVAPWILISPENILPTEDEMVTLLADAQAVLPQGLPLPEWQRFLAAELCIRLQALVADRALTPQAPPPLL
jgi:transcriptional regulator with XRE-family HTH domain